MNCIKCGSEEATDTYFIEVLPCPYCDEGIEIKYHICHECNITWKTVNDEVISMADFDDGMPPGLTDEDLLQAFSAIDGRLVKFSMDNIDGVPTGPAMGELLHRCIRCGSIAFEVSSKRWRCNDPECQFEWEIVSCE